MIRVLLLSIAFLIGGCGTLNNEPVQELETYCEAQEITYECRLAGAIKANSKFVYQIGHALDIGAINSDQALEALDLSEEAERLTRLARGSGDIADLQNAESILLAIEAILIGGI